MGNVSKERNEQRGKSLQLLPRNKEPFLKIDFPIMIFPSLTGTVSHYSKSTPFHDEVFGAAFGIIHFLSRALSSYNRRQRGRKYPLSQRVSPFSYSCHFHLPAKMKAERERDSLSHFRLNRKNSCMIALNTALSFTS